MGNPNYRDVLDINTVLVSYMKAAALQDLDAACALYRMRKDNLATLSNVPMLDLLGRLHKLGAELLLLPRPDIMDLLTKDVTELTIMRSLSSPLRGDPGFGQGSTIVRSESVDANSVEPWACALAHRCRETH